MVACLSYGAFLWFVVVAVAVAATTPKHLLCFLCLILTANPNFAPNSIIHSFNQTMFQWRNFAKSAEATFSRWALKRVCKFFLKKKLGQFILGEIDLDQLDVQLSQGTIQLSDLALNVDFVNSKVLFFFSFCSSILGKFLGLGIGGVNIDDLSEVCMHA